VSSVWPVLLLGVAGLLVGGAISMHRQGSGRVPVVLVGLLSVVALVAGVLWLFPGS
jgi:hypothetical protein